MRSRNWNKYEYKVSEKKDEDCLDDSTIEVSLSSEDEEDRDKDKEQVGEKKIFKKIFDKDMHIENIAISAAVMLGIVGAIIYLPLLLLIITGLMIKEFYDTVRKC
ncbi:hypothetical protein EE548_22870 [Salmonella enterica]|nr:hypothetical protein [Salmonella enterica]